MEEPLLLGLPEEILEIIFTFAVHSQLYTTRNSKTRYQSARALSLTCWRIHSIALPLLYEDPAVEGVGGGGRLMGFCRDMKTYQFCRTIRENPARGLHCKYFALFLPPSNDPNFPLAVATLTHLPNLKSLLLKGQFRSQNIWQLIDLIVRKSSRLEEVDLEARPYPMLLGHIYNHLGLPSGRKLTLHGLKFRGMIIPHEEIGWRYDSDAEPEQGLAGPPAVRPSITTGYKELVLRHYRSSPSDLQDFLLWFTALEKFTFAKLADDRIGMWNLRTFLPALQPHRKTLKHILVTPRQSSDQFSGLVDRVHLNVSGFTALEHLQIPMGSIACTPKTAVAELLAPNMKTLVLDLGCQVQCKHFWGAFSKDHIQWLLKVAKLANKERPSFRRFELYFDPDPSDLDPSFFNSNTKSPWDLMDDARRITEAYGIELVYNEPSLARHNFNKCLARELNMSQVGKQ
ncbi:hypothetical protein EJ08DRAFT_702723 [Tothia fuscella]|uniref:Uncharacterized protein n=1 Tax=Tothia fuscella TaxID=1048955 RepID=A0A9P4NFU4_9PEZI|nr:hypothetical protein EJ08DRAFT_702723 [Tothia fuscella]